MLNVFAALLITCEHFT